MEKSTKNGSSTRSETIPFDYNKINAPSHNFTLVHFVHALHFDRTHYATWKHKMKLYLISSHSSVWKVICIWRHGPHSGERTYIHRNTQAANAILSPICVEEFNKVDGLEEAQDI